MEKLKKTAKGLDVFCQILFWCLIIGTVACAIGLIVVLCLSQDVLSNAASAGYSRFLTPGNGVAFRLPNDIPSELNIKPFFITALLTGLIGCGTAIYALWLMHSMLQPMKNGAPFSSTVSKGFHRLGWLTIIAGIGMNFLNLFGTKAIVNMLSSSVREVYDVSVQYTANMTFLLIAFLFFMFSYVFRYGEELQNLADETL